MTRTNAVTGNKRLSRGEARIALLLAALVVGLVAGGYAHYRFSKRQAVGGAPVETQTLSASTLAVLQRLDAPVEIRLYAPSSSDGLSETTAAFVARVRQLVSEYERAGGDKIQLTVKDPASSAVAKSAAGADGILPLADSNGGFSYLGIAVVQQGRKESIAQLSPDWETALESDLSRAISRVTASVSTAMTPAVQVGGAPATVNLALSEELVRTIPDLETRSFESASQVLREASLAEFTAAVREMQANVQEAQRQLAAAQESKSEADQQAAAKQLQQVQSEGTKKLSEITSRLQERIVTLERLKGVTAARPK